MYIFLAEFMILLLFSHEIVSDSWRPRGLRHSRLLHPHHLLEFAQVISIELVMASNHLILCHPLLFLPSIFPRIRVFSSEWAVCNR